MTNLVTPMSIEEMFDRGLEPTVNSTIVDQDNPVATGIIRGVVQQDAEGRNIISWKQYQEFINGDVRLENYALRMYFPGQRGIRMIPCTKYHKWYGLGFRPVGQLEEEIEKVRLATKVAAHPMDVEGDPKEAAISVLDTVTTEEVVMFRCSSKYAECKRFFDSERGLKFHWRNEHEGGFGKKKVKEA